MTFGFKPLDGEPSGIEKLPGLGPDGKGLFGIGGLLSGGVSSKTLAGVNPFKPPKDISDYCKGFSGISSHGGLDMTFQKHGNSWKIFNSEGGAPMVRLDYDQHGQKPPTHLQFGEKFYSGLYGDKAADVMADIFTKSKKMKLFTGD